MTDKRGAFDAYKLTTALAQRGRQVMSKPDNPTGQRSLDDAAVKVMKGLSEYGTLGRPRISPEEAAQFVHQNHEIMSRQGHSVRSSATVGGDIVVRQHTRRRRASTLSGR